MSTPFLGEIRMLSFGFAPHGWALCTGQILSITQNQALFALLGNTYGGNGTTNFALPDLRGRTPFHPGTSPGGTVLVRGQSGGEETHVLSVPEMPTHGHGTMGSSAAPGTWNLSGATWPTMTSANAYGTSTPDVTMNPASVGSSGGGQAHPNMPPYLVVNFAIALLGTFPSQ